MDKEIFFTTDAVSTELRIDYYRNFFAPLMEIMPIRDEELFCSARIRTFNNLILVDSRYNSVHNYCRDIKIIRKYEVDYYLLILFVEAGCIHTCANGEVFNIEVGDIVFFDLSLTGQGLITRPGRNIFFNIPRELMDKYLKGYRVQGDTLLKHNLSVTRLLTHYMLGTFNVSLELEEEETSIATASLLSLLAVGLKKSTSENLYQINDLMNNSILKNRVENFIDINIKDLRLSVDVILNKFKVSRAHLYRAFEVEGGVVAVIRKKRLNLAYQELSNPLSKLTITQVAFEYGFASNCQFYRAFKHYYGIAPSELKVLGSVWYPKMTARTDLHCHFKKFNSNHCL